MKLNKKILCFIIISVIALAVVITLKTIDINDKTTSPKGILVKMSILRGDIIESQS